MKFNGWEEPKPIPDMLISKNEVLMLIANYQMGTDPHSEIGDAQYSILEMLFRSVQSLTADRKTENSSEIPNNCDTCKHNKLEWYSEVCDGCSKAHSNYEPKDEPQTVLEMVLNKQTDEDRRKMAESVRKAIKDEPQTDTEIAKAIVHKMIDDAVIAEDAYPDLRQKMHDAVDEYESQTDCAWK